VFEIRAHWRASEMVAEDLAAAEIPVYDESGRVVDFHALRTTFGTNLARGGVALQLAQRLMRHSDPKLTSSVYTVLSRDDERAAIAVLPEVGPQNATSPAPPTATSTTKLPGPASGSRL